MFILEGGYHQQSLAEAVIDSFAGILGLPVVSSSGNTVLPEEPLAKVCCSNLDNFVLHSVICPVAYI
jgi:hypothetical protein